MLTPNAVTGTTFVIMIFSILFMSGNKVEICSAPSKFVVFGDSNLFHRLLRLRSFSFRSSFWRNSRILCTSHLQWKSYTYFQSFPTTITIIHLFSTRDITTYSLLFQHSKCLSSLIFYQTITALICLLFSFLFAHFKP